VVKFSGFAPGLGIFFARVYILKFLPYILAQRRRGGVVKFFSFPRIITILFAPRLVYSFWAIF
jgi:hypothetical protein